MFPKNTGVRYLTKHGLPPRQFQAVGFGSTRPIAKEDDKQSQEKNRRIEILLYPPAEKITIDANSSQLLNRLSSWP